MTVGGRWAAVPPWLRLLVSASLLGLLLAGIDVGRLAGTLADARLGFALALLGLTFVERLYSAYRWYVVLLWANVRVPFTALVRITFVSGFLGTFLPGTVGTEALRVYSLARTTSDLSLSLSSVLIDRMLAVLALCLFVLIGVVVSPIELDRTIVIATGSLLVAVVASALILLHPRLEPRLARPGSKAVARGLALVRKTREALLPYRARPRLLVWALVLAVGLQLLRMATAIAAFATVGAETPLSYFVLFVPIINLLTILPISIGGIGVREAGYVYFFGLVGTPVAPAFAAALLMSLGGTLSCCPGAWFLGSDPRSKPT